MIDIKALREADKGRHVRYRGSHATEWGTIKRWNDRYVFVLYTRRQEDGRQSTERTGAIPEATLPEDLEFE